MNRYKSILFLFSFSLFTALASGFIDSQDGFQYLTIARRIYYDGTFEMPDELYPEANLHMSLAHGIDGKVYSPTGLGYTLSLLPAVALEDMFLHVSGASPTTAFPLENDWPVLLFASMTNAFWGALFVTGLYSYCIENGQNQRTATIIALGLVITSNLLVHVKHSFAHMMFVSAFLYAILSIRKAIATQNASLFLASGMWLGIVALSYNPTFLFVVPGLGVYYIVLRVQSKVRYTVRTFLTDVSFGLVGLLPFLATYWWFNAVRLGGGGQTGYRHIGESLKFPPIYVILEGFWGLLFSPGKSIFLYSPLLLLLILFWHQIPRRVTAELLAGLVTAGIYLWFIGTLLGAPDFLVWHGESSWGPRYMLPILPFFLLVIGILIPRLHATARNFVVLPLALIGLYISTLGVVLPYQIRFAGLQTDTFINGRNFTVYEYGNEIPRYAPFFTQTKQLAKTLLQLPNRYDHGYFSVRLLDGFGEPYPVGERSWRGVKDSARISFDQHTKEIQTVAVTVANHQSDPESSQAATLLLHSSDQSKRVTIPVLESRIIELEVHAPDAPFTIDLETTFESSSTATVQKQQIIFLQEVTVNGVAQNLSTLDYPYVSRVSNGFATQPYLYWGNQQQDPWSIWHMHSIIYEKTLDFWWIKLSHYWDIPQQFVKLLAIANVVCILSSGYALTILSRNSNLPQNSKQ